MPGVLVPIATTGPALALQRRGAAASISHPFSGRAPSAGWAARYVAVRAADDGESSGAVATAEQAAVTEQAAAPTGEGSVAVEQEALPELELEFVEPSGGQKAWTSFKLAFAAPWRRVKNGSALVLKLTGQVAEQPQGRFSSTVSLPALCECLKKAALDPRISGVVVKIDPLACGWGKLQELRRHVAFFRKSGKFSMAYLERAGEKEYYLASAFEEIYAPPSASLSLRGLSVSGTFLRGALDKVGVQPEVRRIGKYKSAGDQLLRSDMSEPQREQLTALLDDIYDGFVGDVAADRGKTREEVEALLDAGVYDMQEYLRGGWLTGLLYECELEEKLKALTGGKEDEVRSVGYRKYRGVQASAFGLSGRKAVAVLRTSGAITGGSGGTGSSITAGDVIRQLRALKKNKGVAAVVLRVDSPGGDALASDLMWREIQELAKTKPVIASMSDVAASGGYYMAMACSKVVAEPLTITGSIGVVTGKFNLAALYERLGYAKENISRGKYAQLLAENKAFSPEEEALFDAAAQHAYESFRDKAAASRGMSVEAMQEVAQGRVWSGRRAAGLGLVDAVGGVSRAVQLAKQAAGLKLDEGVRLLEVSRAKVSPLQLLSSGGASLPAAIGMLLMQTVLSGGVPTQGAAAARVAAGAPVLLEALAAAAAGSAAGGAALPAAGAVQAEMPAVAVEGVSSLALLSQGGDSTHSPLFDIDG